jgi:hypothetical protein
MAGGIAIKAKRFGFLSRSPNAADDGGGIGRGQAYRVRILNVEHVATQHQNASRMFHDVARITPGEEPG